MRNRKSQQARTQYPCYSRRPQESSCHHPSLSTDLPGPFDGLILHLTVATLAPP